MNKELESKHLKFAIFKTLIMSIVISYSVFYKKFCVTHRNLTINNKPNMFTFKTIELSIYNIYTYVCFIYIENLK